MPAYPLQQLLDDIAGSLTPSDFDQAARGALQHFDALTEEAAVPVACRAGCPICCWLRVDVFAHEVFLVARHVRAHFNAIEMEALRHRLDVHAARVGALTPWEHATSNIPCPLLENDRCSVYEARPHACRRHHSVDLPTCQYTFDHPTDLDAPSAHDRGLFRTLTAAMQDNIDAYSAFEFDHTIYELGTALHEALSDDSGWTRWLAGEAAFQTASITLPA